MHYLPLLFTGLGGVFLIGLMQKTSAVQAQHLQGNPDVVDPLTGRIYPWPEGQPPPGAVFLRRSPDGSEQWSHGWIRNRYGGWAMV